MNHKTWGIIGTGWLGSALARHLTEAGFKIWGTNQESFRWGVDSFPRKRCDILFINVPPLTHLTPERFVQEVAIESATPKIIFVSSIAVYGNAPGTVTEESSVSPVTANGVWLVQVEQLLIERFKDQVTLIRAGGLIGGDRHPVRALAKRSAPLDEGYVNLIHREDLIGIVRAAAESTQAPRIINAVAPYHGLKSEYYGSWSQKLGLAPIEVSLKKKSDRVVTSVVLPDLYPNWKFANLDE